MVENCCSSFGTCGNSNKRTIHQVFFSQSAACTSGFSANQLHAQGDFQPISCLHKQISCSQLLVQVHIVQLFGQLYFSQSAACTMHMQISANQLLAQCTCIFQLISCLHTYISANQLLAQVDFLPIRSNICLIDNVTI